ncbi:alginate export family protein [Pseudomonas juntendi]|uniref:Alginate export family protein n=1 Tax=Pseudomonas juntendi TaxID=2666183 RepID=A0ABD4Y9L1_9PSED|nr:MULTISPECIES: alginate export family protein [Pseudomonas]MDH0756166.1 alginate export family protein [Pseudomonas juntendi]MDH1919850.1 alginate export family protein [Pseudomonas juntendi]
MSISVGTLRKAIAGTMVVSIHATAGSIVETPNYSLGYDLTSVIGVFHSKENYQNWQNRDEGSSSWQEGFIKYGLKGEVDVGGGSRVYGRLNRVATGTWGDGDAGGFTNGTERTDKWEDALIGWRSGDLVPALGTNGIDISVGRQQILLGDGFLVAGDGVSAGRGAAGNLYNRGGAYYVTGRRSFDQTAMVRIGGSEGLHGSVGWLKSDNPIQAKMEMAFSTLDYSSELGLVGLTFLRGLDVDKRFATESQLAREDMKVYSIRAQGSAGLENVFLSSELAFQKKSDGDSRAGYVEAAYTYATTPWQPTIGYRYSRYGKKWDSLLYGFGRGYGTWFQGEVAANFAGPYSSNTQIHQIYARAQPSPSVTLNAIAYDFDTINKQSALNLSGKELDLYLDFAVSPNVILTPLLGFYKPEKSSDQGGLQAGNNDVNVFSALLISVDF